MKIQSSMKLQYVIFKRSYLYINVKGLLSWQLRLVKSFTVKGLTIFINFKGLQNLKKLKHQFYYVFCLISSDIKKDIFGNKINIFCNSFKG